MRETVYASVCVNVYEGTNDVEGNRIVWEMYVLFLYCSDNIQKIDL